MIEQTHTQSVLGLEICLVWPSFLSDKERQRNRHHTEQIARAAAQIVVVVVSCVGCRLGTRLQQSDTEQSRTQLEKNAQKNE